MNVLAIIPARAGSKGIPGKNFRPMGALSKAPWLRAVHCAAHHAGLDSKSVIVTTDCPEALSYYATTMMRPPELAQDDTPMTLVVQHVLASIPGPREQVIALLQPTQPLREPKHITQALALLTPDVTSVVSVTPCESPDKLLLIHGGYLQPFMAQLIERRQDARPAFKRDGTIYLFRRATFLDYGDFYGPRCVPLIVPHNETVNLDTLDDWAEAERRLKEREG